MPVILFKRQTIETYAPTHAKRGNVPKKMGEHATEIVYNFEKKKKRRKKSIQNKRKKKERKKKKRAKEKKERNKGGDSQTDETGQNFFPLENFYQPWRRP